MALTNVVTNFVSITNYVTEHLTNSITHTNVVNPVDVLQQLGGLYSAGFQHLLMMLTAAFVVVGYFFTAWQGRQLKLREEALQIFTKEKIEQAMIVFKKDQEKLVESVKSDLELSSKKAAWRNRGFSMEIAGNTIIGLDQKALLKRASLEVSAAKFFLRGEGYNPLGIVLKRLEEKRLPALTVDSATKLEPRLTELVRELRKVSGPPGELLSVSVDNLMRAIEEAKSNKGE